MLQNGSTSWPKRELKLKQSNNNKLTKHFYKNKNDKPDGLFPFINSINSSFQNKQFIQKGNNDAFIKKLNKSYKKSNKLTDVLTFISKIKKNSEFEVHCDIIISAETAYNDAKQYNIDFYEHFAHLIIHSILHINGYSHKTYRNFLNMKKKEILVLNKLRITNPYK